MKESVNNKCDICKKDCSEGVLLKRRKPDIELFIGGYKQKLCDECFDSLASWRLRRYFNGGKTNDY